MRKLLILCALVLSLVQLSVGQSMYGDQVKADVKMKYVYSFEEALKLSRETGKPIFFNCFADWAVPCHGMNMKVFSNQEFADWMDTNFVNFFIDVTKGDGKPLARKYNIKTMAHYLVLDANGDIIHRIVGGDEIPVFKKKLELALHPEHNLRAMNASYQGGKRDVKFLRSYLDVLRSAEEGKKATVVLDELFAQIKQKDWAKKENWATFSAKVRTPSDPYFAYLLANKSQFVKSNGIEQVDKEITAVLHNALFPYTTGDSVYNADKFLYLTLLIQRANLSDTKDLQSVFDFAKARGTGNIAGAVEIMDNNLEKWNPNFLRTVDLSLGSLKGLSSNEKNVLTAYWQRRADSFKGTTANHYLTAIRKLNTTTGIKFRDLTFEQALATAQTENKQVFVDCYTVWCGPCKWLDANTFTEKAVGEYFNENFVSIKIDMEKGEGLELRKTFEVTAYPTMFVFDAKGNVLTKVLGAMDGTKLLEKVQNKQAVL